VKERRGGENEIRLGFSGGAAAGGFGEPRAPPPPLDPSGGRLPHGLAGPGGGGGGVNGPDRFRPSLGGLCGPFDKKNGMGCIMLG